MKIAVLFFAKNNNPALLFRRFWMSSNFLNGENLMPIAMLEKSSTNQKVVKKIALVLTKILNGLFFDTFFFRRRRDS